MMLCKFCIWHSYSRGRYSCHCSSLANRTSLVSPFPTGIVITFCEFFEMPSTKTDVSIVLDNRIVLNYNLKKRNLLSQPKKISI